MNSTEVLFYLTSPHFDLIEIKRLDVPKESKISDVYKWLVVDKKRESIWALDFKSMSKVDTHEKREFLEGSLNFDFDSGTLKILGEEITLDRKYPQDVPASILILIRDFLHERFETYPDFTFRHLKPSDVNCFTNWLFDEEVIRYSMTKFHRLKSPHGVQTWFRSTLMDKKSYQLAVIDPKTDELIGYAGIAGLNEIDKNGEFFIFLGNKNYWGRGIATEVTKKMIEVAFTKLNLHRIFLTASSKNPGALRAYEKAGFIREGAMKDAFYRNNEYSDKIFMGLINPN